MNVPFLDLELHHRPLREEILAEWADIYDTAQFVSGARVAAFEASFAAAHEVSHAVAVSNGTTALEIALRALGLGPGDRVVVPANTFIATAEAVSNVGATPTFVDIDPLTRSIAVDDAIRSMDEPGVRAVIPVHLYGQPADLDPLVEAADRRGLAVIEDAAQAHLARYKDRSVGSLGHMACFSFYPGKNLGAPGEGGAITTDDPRLAEKARRLRDHGQSRKYHSAVVGTNARMIELVAAALNVKMRHIHEWTESRRSIAARYLAGLADIDGIELFPEPEWARGVHHLFVIELDDRDALMEQLHKDKIGAGLHYPVPVHLQEAYASLGFERGSMPNAERSAARLLSLPMFPEMTSRQVDAVVESVSAAMRERATTKSAAMAAAGEEQS